MTFPLRLEARQEYMDPVDHSPQIHGKHPLPLFDRRLRRGGKRPDTGIVTQQVNRTESVNGLVGRALNIGEL